MTEEKKLPESGTRTAAPGDVAPDQLRRRLAKAALASPVIMTLGPRRVWGAAGPCGGSGILFDSAAAAIDKDLSVSHIPLACQECVAEHADDEDGGVEACVTGPSSDDQATGGQPPIPGATKEPVDEETKKPKPPKAHGPKGG